MKATYLGNSSLVELSIPNQYGKTVERNIAPVSSLFRRHLPPFSLFMGNENCATFELNYHLM